MKINLIDDTALIETTSIKKDKTVLGLRHYASNTNMFVHNKKRSLHVCGNVRMNQENGNVKFQDNQNLDGNNKLILGCAQNGLKKQQSEDVGLLPFKNFQENDNVGGCAGIGLKKQQISDGNGFKEDEKLMGFLERPRIQENENQEKVSSRNCCLTGVGNITGNEKGISGFDTNLEKNGKTIQVWVARGKVQDKFETAFKDDKVSTIGMVQVQSGNGSGKKIVGTSICYTRKQMEDLRFANIEDQNKKWGAIYCELGPAVKKEYDGLLDSNYHHHPQLDFKKKVTANGIFGPMAVNGSWNHWYLRAQKKGLK